MKPERSISDKARRATRREAYRALNRKTERYSLPEPKEPEGMKPGVVAAVLAGGAVWAAFIIYYLLFRA